MFSGPLFRYEYRAATRKRQPFLFRTFFASVLGIVTLLIGLLVFTANSGRSDQDRLILFGRSVFIAATVTELLFLMFFVPAFVGGSIAEERGKDTLPLLLLTRLTGFEIVLTKTVARWLSAVNMILIGLPVLVASAWVAGLERESVPAVLGLLSSSGFMASLAILSSAQRDQAATARAQATAWVFSWLLGPPVLTVLPIRAGVLWGNLLAELKTVCAFVAPSSPLSLVTDRGWIYRPAGLEERLALMFGLQAVFGSLAIAFAVAGLRGRERNPNWADPTRGYRPPCGDDPIYWREYELPSRRGGGSVVAMRLRYVWILVKAVLITLLTLGLTLLALAIPIGMLLATMHYGFAAFQELWQYGSSGPFVGRTQFNLLVRAATGLIALFPALSQVSLVGARITAERDKKTWEALLTTPLSGGEILWSKSRVAIQLLVRSAWPLLVIWALGVACGAITLLGVLFAAVDLCLVAWAFLALALYSSIRHEPASSATSRTAVGTSLLLLIHGALLAALLASPRELAVFDTWDIRLRGVIVLAGLTVLILTGIAAWILTRRTLDRFDEWVDRPHRARGVQSEGGSTMKSF